MSIYMRAYHILFIKYIILCKRWKTLFYIFCIVIETLVGVVGNTDIKIAWEKLTLWDLFHYVFLIQAFTQTTRVSKTVHVCIKTVFAFARFVVE